MKKIIFTFALLAILFAAHQTYAQVSGIDIVKQVNATRVQVQPGNNPDNPPATHPNNNNPTIIQDCGCTGRNTITVPDDIWPYGWDCTTTLTCTCEVTMLDSNNRRVHCPGSPVTINITGEGDDSSRGACITESNSDADSQRDDFFAQNANLWQNCEAVR